MARYIDADALIEYIDKNVVCTSRDSEECKQFMLDHLAMESFAPTVDVVPRAEVIKEASSKNGCSICNGGYLDVDRVDGYRYCPYCAKELKTPKDGEE